MDNSAQYGGAVYLFDVINSTMTIADSKFMDNSAQNEGGAVILWDTTNTIITITDSEFIHNSAQYGGAVCLWDVTNTTITISDSEFMDNSTWFGGAVYLEDAINSNITITDSEFMDSSAQYGGAVYLEDATDSNVTITDSQFIDNTAQSDGGAVYTYLAPYYRHTTTTINISVCTFNNNRAGQDGAAVSLVLISTQSGHFSSKFIIVLSRSNFTNNIADNGGAVSVYHAHHVIITESVFQNNGAHQDGGVLKSEDTKVEIIRSSFTDSVANAGGVIVADHSTLTVNQTTFTNNAATFGGVMNFDSSGIIIDSSSFSNNSVVFDGGVMFVQSSSINVTNSSFDSNKAGNDGGVVYLYGGFSYDVLFMPIFRNITLKGSTFYNNKATSGGVIAAFANEFLVLTECILGYNNANSGGAIILLTGNTLMVNYCNFTHNSANVDGGVAYSGDHNNMTFSNNVLEFNGADRNGGALCLLIQTKLTITDNNSFIGNKAHSGGVIYASESNVNVHCQTLQIVNNTAMDTGGAMHLFKTNFTILSGSSTIIGNRATSGGAIFAAESRLNNAQSQTLIANNTATNNGGGIYLFEGQIIFADGNSMLTGNEADNGGVVYAKESKVLMERHDLTTIANSAISNGGGFYLVMSELNVGVSRFNNTGNKAHKQGGGLYAANSSIIVEREIHVTDNEAENGGGVSLERYSNIRSSAGNGTTPIVNFVSNRASHHGGALYVDDETNPDMCRAVTTQNATSTTECFSTSVFINFFENFAGVSGSTLFGGLLDRCTVDTKHLCGTEVDKPGVASFQNFSNIGDSQLNTITSHPVRVCFCRDNQPDCNYQPGPIQVVREKTFQIELIAYDQVHNAVNATVHCSLNSSVGGLGEDQLIQHIGEGCTKLNFNFFSPFKTEDLMLSMRGPCNVPGFSERSVRIETTCTCPIGFQVFNNDEVACDCVCDQILQPFDKTECNFTAQSIVRRENFWITYSNSSGLIVYPNCPFDYCHPPRTQVNVNLNLPNGSDAQCASDRMGTLCGTCKPGLSVSLGSSHCLKCQSYLPGLLVMIIVFILSGIGLVALLLVLNLTVAVGTLNAIIFYANIVAANKIALFPTSEVSFASVFISWLNFDLGIDTCFYNGMNTYFKTWLQLAFPVYIFFLVAVIIRLCHHFDGILLEGKIQWQLWLH